MIASGSCHSSCPRRAAGSRVFTVHSEYAHSEHHSRARAEPPPMRARHPLGRLDAELLIIEPPEHPQELERRAHLAELVPRLAAVKVAKVTSDVGEATPKASPHHVDLAAVIVLDLAAQRLEGSVGSHCA